jgi:hypothetical protein
MSGVHFRLTLINVYSSVVADTLIDLLVNIRVYYSRQSPRTRIDSNSIPLSFESLYTPVNTPLADPVRFTANPNRCSAIT